MNNPVYPVIVRAEKQKDRVDRLVRHIKDLDGTDVTVLDADGELPWPWSNNANAAMRQAAAHFKGKAFCWLEPDSIPLRPHWLRDLRAAWLQGGKPIMLSGDSHPPHDLVGGIGVYGPDTHWLIPKQIRDRGWDLWIFNHIPELIHHTPLIQHSYGVYSGIHAEAHRFPRDQHIIRPDAAIFHRDLHQDLILQPDAAKLQEIVTPGEQLFRHNGDLGDVIAAMPIFRALGGGKVILCESTDPKPGMMPRESLRGARYEALKPLLESQSYITGVEWAGNTVDMTDWRTILRPRSENLIERQARHLDLWPVDTSPWIHLTDIAQTDRVIIARSARYHNHIEFPWKDVVDTYGKRILFIGLPPEHAAFEALVGAKVEHAVTDNLLDAAKLIAGGLQFIGNQSCPLWIAMGLGAKVICEVWPHHPNSTIARPGSFFAATSEDMQTLRGAFATVRAKRR